jgi:predicted metal-dependent HD superfamily phosphohydrolase
MNPYKKELKQVAGYMELFFDAHKKAEFLYHNAQHTQSVVAHTAQIANYYALNEIDHFTVMVAAWFHDSGYYLDKNIAKHEALGAELASNYLEDKGITPHIIKGVQQCILATKMPQKPKTLIEQILCDADLFHLGTNDFKENYKLMRKELESLGKTTIDKNEWRLATIKLLESHQFHTDFCQTLLNPKKIENLEKLKNKALKIEEKPKITTKNGSLTAPSQSSLDVTTPKTPTESLNVEKKVSKTNTAAKAVIQETSKNHEIELINFNSISETDLDLQQSNLENEIETGQTLIKDFRIDTPSVSSAFEDFHLPNSETAVHSQISDILNPTANTPSVEMTLFTENNSDNKLYKTKEDKKNKRPERGVETVFRLSSGNNQQLSTQADNKANIMITVNSIIISVLLGVLLNSIQRQPSLVVPTIILLTVNVATIIFAVLATRPTIPHGTFQNSDIDSKKVNLLFFGNFYNMNLKDYSEGMFKMLEDREFLYGNLIQDVYGQGLVLGKKYQLLRISYNIFMYGLITSVIAFIIAIVFFSSSNNLN